MATQIGYQNPASNDLILDSEDLTGSPDVRRERVAIGVGTSGGATTFHSVSDGTDSASVKAAPGVVYGITIFNNAAYPVFVKLHNTTSTPTPGTGIVRTFGVQAGQSLAYSLPPGIQFTVGIGLTMVKNIADSDATALAVGDCVVDLEYA